MTPRKQRAGGNPSFAPASEQGSPARVTNQITMTGPGSSSLRASLLAAVVLVATACGSTVPGAQQVAANGAGQGGLTTSPTIPPGAHVNSKGQIVKNGRVIGTTSGGVAGTTGSVSTTTGAEDASGTASAG